MESSTTDLVTAFDTPLFSFLPNNLTALFTIAFIFIFLGWIIYTGIITYHWIRYGHGSRIAIPVIGIHIFISGLFIFIIAGAGIL